MSGDRSYGNLNVISYGAAAEQRKKVQRGSNYQRKNIRTIHTKNDNMRNHNVRSAATGSDSVKSNGVRSHGTRTNQTRSNSVKQMQRPYDARESSRAYRRKRRRRQAFLARFVCALSICIIAGGVGIGIYKLLFPTAQAVEHKMEGLTAFTEKMFQKEENQTIEDIFASLRAEGISCTQNYLTVNEYSRPGDKLEKVNNIFVHYTANPKTSAAQNRSYFENLAVTHEVSASAHFIIGYEGELIQCIPLEEIAYAVATRNEDSISIECCYLDASGKFTDETYTTLVHFSALLLKKYGLEAEDLRRHYDEGGKACPKYYVENEEEWWKFVQDVKVYKESL